MTYGRHFSLLIFTIIFTVGVGTVASAAANDPAPTAHPKTPTEAVLKVLKTDPYHTTLMVKPEEPLQAQVLTVVTQREKLAGLKVGDMITATIDDAVRPTQITAVKSVVRRVDGGQATLYLAGAVLFAFLVIALLATAATGKFALRAFLVGADNRYSTSQVQVAIWFGAFMAAYLAVVAERFMILGAASIGHVTAPQNIILLTGFSAFTFGAAKAITTSKVNAADAAGAPGKSESDKPKFFPDLLKTDEGNADIGNAQMLLIVTLAVFIFLVSTWNFLVNLQVASDVTLPDVDTSLLTMFGIGQGAYLVKKTASNPGQG